MYADAVASPVAARRDRIATREARLFALAADRADMVAERDRIAAEHDDAPPPSPTRPAPRDDRPGAPFWRLVRFADDVPADAAAGIEAALHAAGLLDAWLHPTGDGTLAALVGGEQDAYLRSGPPTAGPSLADVLVPEDQAMVTPERVTEILTSIALDELAGVAPSGRWGQGAGVGRLVKERCEFIGATARAARRASRIAECNRRIAELDAALAVVVAERDADRLSTGAAGPGEPGPEPGHPRVGHQERP